MPHRRMVAPINAIKHYVQKTNTVITSGARNSTVLIHAVAVSDVSSTDDVVEGSIVKAIYCEWWIKGTGTADADTQFNVVLEKVPGAGATGIDFTEMLNMGSYDNKKNIFFAGQGVIGGIGGGQAIPILRGWYKIPKGKQRFGLGDFFQISVASTGETAQECGFATYKEYS